MDLDKILGICPKSSIPRRIFLWQMTILLALDQIRGTVETNCAENGPCKKNTTHTKFHNFAPPDCYRFVRISRFPGPRVSLPASPHVASPNTRFFVPFQSLHPCFFSPCFFSSTPPVHFGSAPHQSPSAPTISSLPPPGTPGAPRSLRPTICSTCGSPRHLPGGRGRARPILILFKY